MLKSSIKFLNKSFMNENTLDLSTIAFDQYQRYGVASRAIEAIRQDGQRLKILEVGSNIHQLLGKLLPNDSIDYLDLEIPEEMRNKANIIVGDATALTLADGSYDVVVALDVYEHIPQNLRAAFLKHTSRVARQLTVIGAPFDEPLTVNAEKEASDYWKQLFGQPYRWLAEHEIEGLPNMVWTSQTVADMDYQYFTLKHGDIDVWKLLIQTHFAKSYTRSLEPIGCLYDEYYNKHLFIKDFSPKHSYREFIFISKDTPSINKVLADFNKIPKSDNLTFSEDPLLQICKLLLNIPHGMYKEIGEWNTTIKNLNDLAIDRYNLIQSINVEKLSVENQLQELRSELQEIAHTNHLTHNKLAEVYQSSSWRITSPLRFASRQLKRIPRIINLALPAIKHGGGIVGTTQKAFKLLKQDGVSGLKRGLRSVAAKLPADNNSNLPTFFTGNNDYDEWVRQFDTRSQNDFANMRATMDGFAHKPKISVLMPTYNSRSDWLIDAIESVRNQIYTNWELCIADDASTKPEVRPILERYAALDPRIKVAIRSENGHISAASNSALELVSGEWVALFDHDDLLPEHALFWVAHAINQNPDTKLIYSDEDKTDDNRRRFDPYFKSDWNPDLFYSHNMFSHLGVYQTSLMRAVGGFRVGFEGAQDYDLALRCIEKVTTKQIVHIPRVLYQWRVHDQSTALTADSKPYAMIAGERALNEHFNRLNIDAKAKLIGYGYEVSYALPNDLPMVSIIIPTRNGLSLLQQCIDSIHNKTNYSNYEIIIVDNDSNDKDTLDYLEALKKSPNIQVLRIEEPFNYSRLNNLAANQARGEVLVLMNNDIEVISENWLSEMVSQALRPEIGAVGAKLYFPDGTLQHGGVVLGIGGVAGHAHRLMPKGHLGYMGRAALISNFSAITGACLAVRKSSYMSVGGLNEIDLAIGYNDVDFCLKLREAGYRNIWTPKAELFHHESATRGSDLTGANQIRFQKEFAYMKQKWESLLLNDPAYSPNLTLNGDDFSYAWPSRAPILPVHPRLNDYLAPDVPTDRVAKTLHMLKKDGLGLEIGPSHNPMAPKKAGYNVHVLDHATAAELKVKYTGHPVNLDNIEEVDFVWRGEPLSELVGREHCYDWIVASHVIEHVTDFVGFLNQCEKLLAPDGVISLVVPDKRYCFDYYRWPSNTGDALQAFTDKRVRHTPGTVFDHFANASKMRDDITWTQSSRGDIKMVHTLDEAESYWKQALKNDEYIDSHSWKFTPSSFRIILHDLQKLGLTDLAEVGGFDTEGFEFWIQLGKRRPDSVIYDRQELNRKMMREIGQSIECLA